MGISLFTTMPPVDPSTGRGQAISCISSLLPFNICRVTPRGTALEGGGSSPLLKAAHKRRPKVLLFDFLTWEALRLKKIRKKFSSNVYKYTFYLQIFLLYAINSTIKSNTIKSILNNRFIITSYRLNCGEPKTLRDSLTRFSREKKGKMF